MSIEPIVVTVEQGLADLVPLFIAQRKTDLAALPQALKAGDFESIRRIGHGMAGAGASYGFDYLSDLGQRLELASRERQVDEIISLQQALDDYLARLVVKYS